MSVEEQMTRRIKLEAIQEHAAEVTERWPFCRVLTLTVVNYYHEDVPWLLREVERSRAEVERLTRLLEGLTPGGSEFYDSPDRCAEFARDMMDGAAKQALLRKAAEAEVVRLTAMLCGEEANDGK